MERFVSVASKLLACVIASLLLGCGGGDDAALSSPPSDDLDAYVDTGSADLARVIADPVRPYVYVSDTAGNSVHFFNTDTYRVDLTLAVGSGPEMMDMKADGSLLFVALTGGSSVAVIDLAARTLLAPINVPGTPTGVAVGANDRLYVSILNIAAPISIFDVSTLPASADGTLGGSNIVISGITADRTRMMTHDQSSALALTQWNVSAAVAAFGTSADVYSGPPVIWSSPDSTKFILVGNSTFFPDSRFPLEDGNVPVFRTSDLLTDGTPNVEWDPLAVAICPPDGKIVIAHWDSVTNPTTPVELRHSQKTGDLHVFDGTTYLETRRYALRDFVDEYGLACGPDGRIYMILGTGAIGVIEP
jgi:DNA-binding beta-propeller fold protein YncE